MNIALWIITGVAAVALATLFLVALLLSHMLHSLFDLWEK